MAYKYKACPGIVFIEENNLKKAKNGFGERYEFGRADELELIKYINKFLRKHKEYSHIKVWDSNVFQSEVMGIRQSNILNTELGDVVVRKEIRRNPQVLGLFDCKRSRDASTNATASHHKLPTDFFNSNWNSFYATKKQEDWFAVWGQDLVMTIPEGIDIRTGNRWWTKKQLSKLLIPLDDLLVILFSEDNDLVKCDNIDALRMKYNYVKPKSVQQIKEEMEAESLSIIPEPTPESAPVKVAKATSRKKATAKKNVNITLNSKTPGYYATIPVEQCLNAESSIDNVTFILTYCPKDNEAEKDPVKVSFNDIKDVWKSLVIKNSFIRSKDLTSYFKKT